MVDVAGVAAVVGAPTERRYRTAVAAIPACPIMPFIETDEASVGKLRGAGGQGAYAGGGHPEVWFGRRPGGG
ncbi:hypothetical protein SSP35_05_00570 [Streptomyces sp. NBRC 110611]|nr:hypothetical protein SSP35_05_00570 [Streptomyces sp. NBRC 110611]